MARHSLQRLLGLIPTLLMLITVAFLLMRVAPGGPFDSDKLLPPDIEANLNAKYHLDESLPQQYFRYLGQVAVLDFGPSIQYKDWTVRELIAQGIPVSSTIGLAAMLLAFVLGTTLGITAALKQNTRADYLLMGVGMLGISIPNFVIAPILILLLAVYAGWLPAGGWDWGIASMVLPVVTLSLPVTAYIARLTRASMIEVMHSNFIRSARAKGLPESLIIRRHALRPALLPVISFLGPATAAMISGSVVIERIFSIPGLGSYFVQGALNRDYTLVMG
ncbi:MAG: ABC transporter permease subunit, partial [Gammaproteobacteria bacterium]|nr:ABC transporter permease subunit [Gammaproteobacteria bacterium]